MTAKLWGEWQISAGRAIAHDTTGRKSMPVLQQRTVSIPIDEFAHIGIGQFSSKERERERDSATRFKSCLVARKSNFIYIKQRYSGVETISYTPRYTSWKMDGDEKEEGVSSSSKE